MAGQADAFSYTFQLAHFSSPIMLWYYREAEYELCYDTIREAESELRQNPN